MSETTTKSVNFYDLSKSIVASRTANNVDKLIKDHGYYMCMVAGIDQLRYFENRDHAIMIDFEERYVFDFVLSYNGLGTVAFQMTDEDFEYVTKQYNDSVGNQKDCINNIINRLKH